MRFLLFSIAMCPATLTQAQVLHPRASACATNEGAVHVTPLHGDSTASSFLICIDTEVKLHLHRAHTEHVFIVDGEGMMRLGDDEQPVKPGDVVVIPPGTPHAVRVTSAIPLRVISVQSPHFDGSDRVLLPE